MSTVVRTSAGQVQAVCDRADCDWRGLVTSTRTSEGRMLAERDGDEHDYAHEHHTGFYHYERGWVSS